MPTESSSSQMQLENNSQPQNTPLSNLQKFLNNYNKFIEENITIQFNSQTIISDIALNLFQPPRSALGTENSELNNLYLKGKKLPQTLDKDSRQLQELVSRLKKLKEQKLYETIMYIEKLNLKLNTEYEDEVNRGVSNGVYSRKMSGKDSVEGLSGSYRNEKNLISMSSYQKGEKVGKWLEE